MRADALVLFGATGDLAHKKLFPSLYHMAAAKQLGVPVVGVAVSPWDDAQLRAYAVEAVRAAEGQLDGLALTELAQSLAMVSGDYQDPATFAALASRLAAVGAARPVFYLAIPPGLFPVVVQGLAQAGLGHGARVVVEKPFGRDLASAQELNRVLHQVFPERAIFRIDHYLGGIPHLCSLPRCSVRLGRARRCRQPARRGGHPARPRPASADAAFPAARGHRRPPT